ncbi:TrlF family AAA-like ATPase [Coralliovum pocilloporae]|uniref:TrlF family AAA-like ATPase n=1 Tax=Coralliovum pocilloporae TaxID=3066369 RepID=UPI003306F221
MKRFLDPALATLVAHGATPQGIKDALSSSNGSQYVKCAFQVNPFAYGSRHAKGNGFTKEDEFNNAMVKACQENGVEVVALTDHFRFDHSESLRTKLEEAGITVFPGFEANSAEGVHILCLFPPGTTSSDMNENVGACDIRNRDDPSPIARKGFEEILEVVHDRGGITISAHVTQSNGLLKALSGQTRMNAWKSPMHLASAIPGPRGDVPPEYRQICLNKDDAHKRDRPVSFINASDVSAPGDFAKPGNTTFLKMTEVSIEGLRQAFLDGESRVMLNSDELPSEFTRVVAVTWDGGLLDGQYVALNAGLNVMIGGRGAGKSTIVESLRFAFDIPPLGADAAKSHESMIKHLLGSHSAVSVLIFSPSPSPGYYLIERAYKQEPRVRNQSGDIVAALKPGDIISDLEVYGQHEISEITRHKGQLAELLGRFVSTDNEATVSEDRIKERFRTSRKKITALGEKIAELDLALAALPGLKERLKRFEETELATRLKEHASIQHEHRILDDFSKAIAAFEQTGDALKPDRETASTVLPSEEEAELPHREDLAKIQAIAQDMHEAQVQAASVLAKAAQKATTDLVAIRSEWEPKADAVEATYKSLKKELEGEGFEPDTYLIVKQQVSVLKPKQAQKDQATSELVTEQRARQGIVDEWEKADRKAYRDLENAAKRVSKKLKGTVRASVRPSSDLGPLEQVLRDGTEGQISQALTKLQELEDFLPSKLAATIRKGTQALSDEFGFTNSSSQKIAAGGETLALLVEETRIPPEAVIELNIGRDGVENWKELDRLSAGQKATAVLMLLLLESDAPLIIDQPEDDLDNQFIAGHVVEKMRIAKKQRQFLFSSHNPNIPVLGDADQIIGLTPVVEDGLDRTKIEQELCGSIDKEEVQELIKELLEGGEQAFSMRRRKYGF